MWNREKVTESKMVDPFGSQSAMWSKLKYKKWELDSRTVQTEIMEGAQLLVMQGPRYDQEKGYKCRGTGSLEGRRHRNQGASKLEEL